MANSRLAPRSDLMPTAQYGPARRPLYLKTEANFHRCRTAFPLTVVNRFDVVTIGIEYKGRVVPRVISSLTGCAVITAAVCQRRLVKASTVSRSARKPGDAVLLAYLRNRGY